ncbi:MAG: hypothetical protein AAFZ65_04910 [Planctomycetota bacterium]
MRSLLLLACALPLAAPSVLAAPRALADVHVVAAAGGGDFTNLQVAVDAAADGDTLLIKSGNYSLTTLANRSLTLLGDVGANPRITRVRVQQLAPSARVELIGLTISSSSAVVFGSPRLDITDCEGTVVAQDCDINGAATPFFDAPAPGVAAVDSDAVFLIDCALAGGSGSGFGQPNGLPGAAIERSTVHVYGGTLRGGSGFTEQGPTAGVGGAGLTATESVLFLSGSHTFGGAGADGVIDSIFEFSCVMGAPGGAGILLLDSELTLRDVTTTPGAGGTGAPSSGCPAGVDGLPIDRSNSNLVDLPGEHRTLSVAPNPIREGQTASVRFGGTPGDAVFWVFGFESSGSPTPLLGGPILPAAADFVLPQGVLPPSGELIQAVGIPTLGVPILTFFEQSLHLGSDGSVAVSTPQVVEHLSSGF